MISPKFVQTTISPVIVVAIRRGLRLSHPLGKIFEQYYYFNARKYWHLLLALLSIKLF